METTTLIFNSNVKLVQLYWCNTWKVTIQITEIFQNLIIGVGKEKLA